MSWMLFAKNGQQIKKENILEIRQYVLFLLTNLYHYIGLHFHFWVKLWHFLWLFNVVKFSYLVYNDIFAVYEGVLH